jgi:hypothetical protein
MKTTRPGVALLALALLPRLPLPHAAAASVSEPPDFPNSAAAVTATFTYTLTARSDRSEETWNGFFLTMTRSNGIIPL